MEPPSTTIGRREARVRCTPLPGTRAHRVPAVAGDLLSPVARALGVDEASDRGAALQLLDAFIDALAREGDRVGRGLVDGLMAEGYAADGILLGLLTPAAQRLGQRWEDDTASFFEVTVATGHLQELLRRVESTAPPFVGAFSAPEVLLVTPEGDDHTFGALLFQAVLRIRGWGVIPRPPFLPGLEAPLGRERLAVLGISIGSRRTLRTAKGMIARARRIAANPALVVLAGGPLISVEPEAASELGADGAAGDAEEALNLMRTLVPKDLQPNAATA
jgi:methanogenic corrinoid protein MtbC1